MDLRVNGAPPSEIPAGVGLAAYRVMQEALTNAVKHGCDDHADVMVDYGQEAITIEVRNGTPPTSWPGGGRLRPCRHARAARAVRRRLRHGRNGNGSFRLWARLPYTEAAR